MVTKYGARSLSTRMSVSMCISTALLVRVLQLKMIWLWLLFLTDQLNQHEKCIG